MADTPDRQEGEVEEEIGTNKAWAVNLKAITDLFISNMKRTYDEYQQESLESIKRNRTIVDKIASDAQQFDNQRQVVANQALQNAVETANMVGKQAVRHGDIAIDNEWNPVQQGAGDTLTARSVTIDDAALKALGAVIAASVANALSAASSLNPKA